MPVRPPPVSADCLATLSVIGVRGWTEPSKHCEAEHRETGAPGYPRFVRDSQCRSAWTTMLCRDSPLPQGRLLPAVADRPQFPDVPAGMRHVLLDLIWSKHASGRASSSRRQRDIGMASASTIWTGWLLFAGVPGLLT